MKFFGGLLLASSAATVLALPTENEERSFTVDQTQLSARQSYASDASTRANAVKEAFQHAWDGYKKYAFPNDQLNPVSNTVSNPRNAWGASAVDALSTALVMQNSDIVDQILAYIPTIDYSKTDTAVSLFETTIRYLGGMLSAYDLLKGPLSDLSSKPDQVQALLDQSVKLADALSFAFETPSGIPHNNIFFTNGSNDGSPVNGLATAGSLILEWNRLSDLTGNKTYSQLAQKAESYLLNPKPASSEPFPGLVGTKISVENGTFQDATGGWNGGDDSFYEYLIKMYVYDKSKFSEYKDRWTTAADSTIKHLTSNPQPRPDTTFLATYSGTTLNNNSQHLTCFDGGNFLLGGSVLGNQDYTNLGLALVDGCHKTYNQTATRIGPEAFAWNPKAVPAEQKAFYQKNGFYITSAIYDLRPEVIESYYYAYRLTGDTKYQDWAWDAFVAINSTTRTDSGFTAISNVNVQGGGDKMDLQESFLFAEVLKYSYLIFAPDADFQVSKSNEFVYNTEAHPIKVKTTS